MIVLNIVRIWVESVTFTLVSEDSGGTALVLVKMADMIVFF